jgi:hypothetical protein
MARAAFTAETLFNSKSDLNVRKILIMCYILSKALNGPETLTIRERDQKYLESFKMWYGTDCLRN